MTPVLQPFLSEMPVASKPRRVPVGTFTVARVSNNTSAPWSPKFRAVALEAVGEKLPRGIVAEPRRLDMSRHATVVLA